METNERIFKDEIKIDSILFPQNDFYTLAFYGDKSSSTVYDKKSLNYFERSLNYDPIFSIVPVFPFASVDYPEIAKKIIDNSTPTSLRNSLLQLFSIEGKINKSIFQSYDLLGSLLVSEMVEKQGLYSGELVIKISAFCADCSLDLLSEVLLSFGSMLSIKYSSINVSISIRQSITT